MAERRLDDFIRLRLCQKTFPISAIKPLFSRHRKRPVVKKLCLVIPRLRMLPLPFLFLTTPLIQLLLRNGICQPERDKHRRTRLFPMRKIAATRSHNLRPPREKHWLLYVLRNDYRLGKTHACSIAHSDSAGPRRPRPGSRHYRHANIGAGASRPRREKNGAWAIPFDKQRGRHGPAPTAAITVTQTSGAGASRPRKEKNGAVGHFP